MEFAATSIKLLAHGPQSSKQKEPREALELPVPVSIEPEQPEVEVKQVETSELKPHFRRVYLRQDDFDKFGYSAVAKLVFLYARVGLTRSQSCRGLSFEDRSKVARD